MRRIQIESSNESETFFGVDTDTKFRFQPALTVTRKLNSLGHGTYTRCVSEKLFSVTWQYGKTYWAVS